MKKILAIFILIILLSGCVQDESFDLSFAKSDENNNVFEKEEVTCVFNTTQMITGNPNYPGTNSLYDSDPLKESFEIQNYSYSENPTEHSMELTITGLNSSTPKIIGNSGEEKLITLNDNLSNIETKMFLEEGPAYSDNISAYNISSNGSAIWVKTYDIVEPFALIYVGYCE